MKPDGYWCRECGDLTLAMRPLSDYANDYCQEEAIPRFVPLAVPEETTWGASGGEEAVCCEHIECVDGSGGGGVLDYSLGSDVWRDRAASIYDDGEILVHEPVDVRGLSFAYSPCADVASAIRFAAGS